MGKMNLYSAMHIGACNLSIPFRQHIENVGSSITKAEILDVISLDSQIQGNQYLIINDF